MKFYSLNVSVDCSSGEIELNRVSTSSRSRESVIVFHFKLLNGTYESSEISKYERFSDWGEFIAAINHNITNHDLSVDNAPFPVKDFKIAFREFNPLIAFIWDSVAVLANNSEKFGSNVDYDLYPDIRHLEVALTAFRLRRGDGEDKATGDDLLKKNDGINTLLKKKTFNYLEKTGQLSWLTKRP